MAVQAINLNLERGADFETTFEVTNPDNGIASLVGYSATARLKKHSKAQTYTAFSINIIAGSGEITISMSNVVTLTLEPGRHYYDVFITRTSNGKKTKVVEGMVLVSPSFSV